MKAIVYTSNSGFTKHYAELLSEETGLRAYELEEARHKLDTGAEIIFMGWLMAGGVKGYQQAAKRYKVKAVCAVGMGSFKESLLNEIKARHGITSAEVFYLQGGFDMAKLRGIYKLTMKAMLKMTSKKLETKADKTEEDIEILEMSKGRIDKVRIENLAEVIAWLKKQK